MKGNIIKLSLDSKDDLIKSLQNQLGGKSEDIIKLQGQLKSSQTQLNDIKSRLAKCEEENAQLKNNSPGSNGSGSQEITPPGTAP